MAKSKKVVCLYDTDVVARNLWLSLLGDFRTTEGDSFCREAERAFTAGIKPFRDYVFPEIGIISKPRFRRLKQMQELLKKYRFGSDAYSDEELRILTLQKYFGDQERLARRGDHSALRLMVAQRARAIARKVLGPYDTEYVVSHSRFGSRSSIGCPLSKAYIDQKLTDRRAFTSSTQCSKWFFSSVLYGDKILNHMVQEMGVKPQDRNMLHDSLNLVTVPKNWKTYRIITPLTLIALFYSNGVGSLVTKRLAESGLDISRLQSRHQNLVKGFSRSCSHATADLSAASDSITMELLNQVLPREWYRAVSMVTTHQIVYSTGDRTVQAYTESVLPMGNGLTFPIETLVFYSLIKAIGELAGIEGIFSVYGDDLIYPSKLHPYIVRIFPLFGLKLNLDKTFVKYPFRESCGADFYRGADSRPFYLQGEGQKLSRTQYQAFLYKTYNGLIRRWEPQEIRRTLVYLIHELLRVSDEILRIPPGYPDAAGIKVSSPRDGILGMDFLPVAPIWLCLDQFGNSTWSFRFLKQTSSKRFVVSVLPYYWLALQGLDDADRKYSSGLVNTAERSQGISWVKCVRLRYYTSQGRRRLKRVVTYSPSVPSRTMMEHVTSRGSTFEWI